MNTKIKKSLSLVLAMALMLSASIPASAATILASDATDLETEENSGISEEITGLTVSPRNKGDAIVFHLGETGEIKVDTFAPTFEIYAYGSSATTKVNVYPKSPGGTEYGPCGPIPGDGSSGWRFRHTVLHTGTWEFRAELVSGNPYGLNIQVVQVDN